ncbi:MAG TPA: carboxypeptidase regulatory-like domain-containing protein [Candidatus Acidoferrales bacterium]|nr:carboxypeptidase regulatory-like domain-containing protein [Candidatus Acidoferrales bacterium]
MCRHGEPFLLRIRNVFRVVLRLFLLQLVFIASRAWAQDASTGALRGVVLDGQGAVITNADIVAIRVETGIRYHSATDSAGRFAVDLLPPGQYSARAEAEGMSPQISPMIRVEVGAAAQLTFKLKVTGPKESITVSEAPRIETDPSSVSALVDERAIKDLPLNGRRFTDLLLLSPGVTQDPRDLTSGSNGDLSYGGIRGYNTSFLVDGGDNNNGFYGQAMGRYRSPYQFSNELVQEFRVQSSGYGAESGRAGGAVVNVVTKSGTNQWHGGTFYYLRDSSLGGATPPFTSFNPHNEQHQFGATLGGPIQRSRTFVFAAYDQHIFNVPSVVEFMNGATTVAPQYGYPNILDYEVCPPSVGGTACDQTLVAAAAAELSLNAGTKPTQLQGETGSVRLDRVLTAHQYLTARVSMARSYGTNNVTFDAGSPITNDAVSANGEEDVTTETASLSLSSGITPRVTSHLRAQFSRDWEDLVPNTTGVQSDIYGWMENMGQSSTLPRQTHEHRLHLAETLGWSRGRNEWKFGADAMRTWDYNYFPSMFGGKYIFDDIYVDALTFQPEPANWGNLKLTPLRAWAHTVMPSWNWDAGSWSGPPANVARYYEQNFGNPVSYPGSSDYAAFVQDTARVTPHLSLSMGVRYDLQTFSKNGMVTNPLWPQTGKMPQLGTNFAPRVGIGYAFGNDRPVMVRAGFGIFYTRIPGIYQTAVMNDNGLTDNFLSLDNSNYYQNQVFPTYPNSAVNCPRGPVVCTIPAAWQPYATAEVSAFAPDFKTPRVQQTSLSLEREMGGGFTGTLSYLFVHGVDMIRARDVNLPPPTYYSYPIYDPTGYTFQNQFYNVWSFATWQTTQSMSCPYPPCINPLVRPIPQLGAIDEFESAASTFYNGMTVSLRKRMSRGMDFRLAYTWAHAIDDGQDAPATGGATVQTSYTSKCGTTLANSPEIYYCPNQSEKASSVTDQRQRLSIAAIEEPNPFAQGQQVLAAIFDHWRISGIMTYGSGRPANAMVEGDPNQDGNTSNDRLSGYGRNAFIGPDYASMDMRVTRTMNLGGRYHLELTAESFNLFNRDNQKYEASDSGYYNLAGQFIKYTQYPVSGGTPYPAYYQQPASLMKPTASFAPRQMQFSARLNF